MSKRISILFIPIALVLGCSGSPDDRSSITPGAAGASNASGGTWGEYGGAGGAAGLETAGAAGAPGGGGMAPITDRNLIFEGDFESGQVNAATFQQDGVYRDAFKFHQAGALKTFTVTNITKANPAVMSWTGTDPGIYEGVTLGTISSGMTELSRHLVRCQPTGYDAAGNSCRLYMDGDLTSHYDSGNGVCRAANTAECFALNSTSFGTWSGTTPGTTWERVETLDGGLGPSSPLLVHVVKSDKPVDTVNGSANAVTPLLGSFFLSARLDYWRDHSTFDGNGFKNKPRWIGYTDIPLDAQEEVCASAGVFLPSNYEHKNTSNFEFGSNETINFPIEGDNVTIASIRTVGQDGPGGVDHWYLDFDDGSGRLHIDLGSVVPDLDQWTVFTVHMKPGSKGTLQVWKSTGSYLGGTKQRTDTLVYDRVGKPVADDVTNYRFQIRQYLHSWHHHADLMDSADQWVGFDEVRLTRFVKDGGTCKDVHPFGADLK